MRETNCGSEPSADAASLAAAEVAAEVAARVADGQVVAWLLTGEGGRYVRLFREAKVEGRQLASLMARHLAVAAPPDAAAVAHADTAQVLEDRAQMFLWALQHRCDPRFPRSFREFTDTRRDRAPPSASAKAPLHRGRPECNNLSRETSPGNSLGGERAPRRAFQLREDQQSRSRSRSGSRSRSRSRSEGSPPTSRVRVQAILTYVASFQVRRHGAGDPAELRQPGAHGAAH